MQRKEFLHFVSVSIWFWAWSQDHMFQILLFYATHYSCRHLNTINSATLGLVWLNYMQPTFVFSLCMSYCNAKIRIECGLSYTIHPVGACPAISLFSSYSKRCIANPGLFCLGCTWQPQGAWPNWWAVSWCQEAQHISGNRQILKAKFVKMCIRHLQALLGTSQELRERILRYLIRVPVCKVLSPELSWPKSDPDKWQSQSGPFPSFCMKLKSCWIHFFRRINVLL